MTKKAAAEKKGKKEEEAKKEETPVKRAGTMETTAAEGEEFVAKQDAKKTPTPKKGKKEGATPKKGKETKKEEEKKEEKEEEKKPKRAGTLPVTLCLWDGVALFVMFFLGVVCYVPWY